MKLNFVFVVALLLFFISCASATPDVHYMFESKWGSPGTNIGQFSNPYGIAISPNDIIYVADSGNHRIQTFEGGWGEYIPPWGSQGSGINQFQTPHHLAFNNSGYFYIADLGNNRIVVYNPQNEAINTWGIFGTDDGNFNQPYGIAIDSSDNVYVSDYGNHRIQKFTPDGQFITKWGSLGSGTNNFNYPTGLVVDNSGNILVCDSQNNRISKYTNSGVFIISWGTGGTGDLQFNRPCGIVIAKNGHLIISDTYNHRIQELTENGEFYTKWGSEGTEKNQFSRPDGLAIDSAGNLYVLEVLNNRIQKFSYREEGVLSNSGGGSWQYDMDITIQENSGSALTDYPVLIKLNATNFNFDSAKPDGSDIRFTDNSGYELSYWIEDFNSSSKEGLVWVKVPNLLSNGAFPITMHYGNTLASSNSNGHSVFELYDDFNNGLLDLSTWTTQQNPIIVDGKLIVERSSGVNFTSRQNSEYDEYIKSIKYYGYGHSLKTRTKFYSHSGWEGTFLGFLDVASSSSHAVMQCFYQHTFNPTTVFAHTNSPNKYDYFNGYTDDFHSYEITWISGYAIYTVDSSTTYSHQFSWLGPLPIKAQGEFYDGARLDIDWIFVRKYVAEEPSVIIKEGEPFPIESYNLNISVLGNYSHYDIVANDQDVSIGELRYKYSEYVPATFVNVTILDENFNFIGQKNSFKGWANFSIVPGKYFLNLSTVNGFSTEHELIKSQNDEIIQFQENIPIHVFSAFLLHSPEVGYDNKYSGEWYPPNQQIILKNSLSNTLICVSSDLTGGTGYINPLYMPYDYYFITIPGYVPDNFVFGITRISIKDWIICLQPEGLESHFTNFSPMVDGYQYENTGTPFSGQGGTCVGMSETSILSYQWMNFAFTPQNVKQLCPTNQNSVQLIHSPKTLFKNTSFTLSYNGIQIHPLNNKQFQTLIHQKYHSSNYFGQFYRQISFSDTIDNLDNGVPVSLSLGSLIPLGFHQVVITGYNKKTENIYEFLIYDPNYPNEMKWAIFNQFPLSSIQYENYYFQRFEKAMTIHYDDLNSDSNKICIIPFVNYTMIASTNPIILKNKNSNLFTSFVESRFITTLDYCYGFMEYRKDWDSIYDHSRFYTVLLPKSYQGYLISASPTEGLLDPITIITYGNTENTQLSIESESPVILENLGDGLINIDINETMWINLTLSIHNFIENQSIYSNLNSTFDEGSTLLCNLSNPYDIPVDINNDTLPDYTIQPPKASFFTDPLSAHITDTIFFDSSGSTDDSGIMNYLWDFGDNTNASGINVTHQYNDHGIYNCTLVVVDNDNYTGSLTKQIFISDAPLTEPLNSSFSSNITSGLVPFTVQFNDSSSGSITSRFWSLGDGTSAENVTEVSHTYTTPGNYNVTLTISGPDGEDSSSQMIYAYTNTSGWKFRSDLRNSGVYDDGGVRPEGALLWSFPTSNLMSLCPAIVDNIVYVGCSLPPTSGEIYALDAETGSIIWNYTTGNWVGSSPAVANGIVYVGCDDHNLYALDTETGAFLWSYSTGGNVGSSPAVADGIVYVGSEDNNLYALNAETGALIWNYTTGGRVRSSPAVANGFVYVGSDDNKLYALNAETGALIWNYTTGDWVDSSPSVVNGIVYLASQDDHLYALDAVTGALIWSNPIGISLDYCPAVANGIVYIGDFNGNLYAFNATSGSIIWSYPAEGNAASSPAVANGVVYIGGYDLYALDAATGDFLWNYPTGDFLHSNPVVSNGIVYIGAGGQLYALGPYPDIPPDSVTNLHAITTQQHQITWSWTDPISVNFSHVMVYLDGAFQQNVTKGVQEFTASGLNPGTSYTISTRSVGTTGLINETWVNNTASTKTLSPLANFTTNATLGQVPLPIQFTDNSTGKNITSRLWTFGDGGTSTETDPVYTYTTPGLFTVSLEVTNDGGSNTSTKTNYIRVFDATPIADFIAEPQSGDAPLTVQFHDISVGLPTGWQWNLGDGTTTTHQSPSHTYTAAGNYTVTLTAGSSGGTNTTMKTDFIQVFPESPPEVPVANFTADVWIGRFSAGADFYDTSTGIPDSWNWSFGDGSYSGVRNPWHYFSGVGSYPVSLTVSNSAGSDTISRDDFIVIPTPPPEADFSGSPRYGTFPLTVEFTDYSVGSIGWDTPPATYEWNFGDGSPNSTEKGTVHHHYMTAGTYNVTLTVTDIGGSDTLTLENYIGEIPPPQPIADFTATPKYGYAPLTVDFIDQSTGSPLLTYIWDLGDGNTSYEKNPSHTYATPGLYNVTLITTNIGGSDTVTKAGFIEVIQAPSGIFAEFTATPRSGTLPHTVDFIDQSGGAITSWGWSFGDGGSSTEKNPTHIFTKAGSYTITLTITGVDGSSSEEKAGFIEVNEIPALHADYTSNQTAGTTPITVQFYDNSTGNPSAWAWVFEKDTYYPVGDVETKQAIPYYGNEFSHEKNPVVTYSYPGNYSVSLTVSRTGETDTITKDEYIKVIPPPPVADFSTYNSEGPAPLEVEFDAYVPYWYYVDEWIWDFGDGTIYLRTSPWITHTYNITGLYNVTLTVNSLYGNDTTTKVHCINVTQELPPVASFNAMPQSGDAPLYVVFTDTSSGTVTSRLWDFGDGTIEWANATPDVTHSYSLPGNYTVGLTAGNDGGHATATRSEYIQVNPSGTPPHAMFSISPMMGYSPLTVRFTDRSSGMPLKWLWNFGDGNTSSEPNPTHTYTKAGGYIPTLTVYNTGGSDFSSSFVWVRSKFVVPNFKPSPTVTVTPPVPSIPSGSPISFFAVNKSFGSAPMSVQFIDKSFNNPTTWQWDFGDNHTSTVENPVNTFTESGTYLVRLTVKNSIGESTTSRRIYVRRGKGDSSFPLVF